SEKSLRACLMRLRFVAMNLNISLLGMMNQTLSPMCSIRLFIETRMEQRKSEHQKNLTTSPSFLECIRFHVRNAVLTLLLRKASLIVSASERQVLTLSQFPPGFLKRVGLSIRGISYRSSLLYFCALMAT